MSTLIVVVAELPTHIEWLERHYIDCELAWFKDAEGFLEMFPRMETSGRLKVIISEEKLPVVSKALIIGPMQLSLNYSTDELKLLIDNALQVHEPFPAAAFA